MKRKPPRLRGDPERDPWPGASACPATDLQIARIKILADEVGAELPRAPRSQAEAYRWLGELGGRVFEKRQSEPAAEPAPFTKRGDT